MDEKKEALIIEGTEIEGKISGSADVRVEGKVSGEVDIDSTLFVAPHGETETDVKAQNVVVEGKHSGNVNAAEFIQIAPEGRVKANLNAPAISIEKGAKFSGKIDMYDEE